MNCSIWVWINLFRVWNGLQWVWNCNFYGMKKTIKRYEMEEFWYEIASQRYEKLKVWKYTRRYENDVGRYEKIPKVWNRNSRYEIDTQGMNKIHKVIKRVLRYEIEVFLKNSDFSYLYGSISYLFGYEKNRCFFLMTNVPSKHIGRNLASQELHYFPVTLFTHTHASYGIVVVIAHV